MKTINNYAELVKEKHALNKTLAPVETDLTGASQPYAKGAKFIYNGIMYQAKTAIAQGDALVLNTNYEAADNVTKQLNDAEQNIYEVMGEMGAKNLIPYPYSKGTTTTNGVTYTVNADGSISADSDGVGATDTSIYRLYGFTADTKYITLPAGSYILNGCPAEGGSSSYRIFINRQGDVDAYAIDDGEGATFTLDTATNIGIAIRVAKDYVADEVIIKPMIRLATDTDDTYQPYAKTNKELTDDVSSLNTAIANEAATRSVMGAKNLIPFPYPKESDTVLGIDFTTNSDGEIIASGTSTGIAVYDAVNTELYGWNVPREGTYILSDGLSDADYEYAYTAVTFMYSDGTIEYNVGDTSIGRTVITIPSNLKNFYVGCCIRTDKTVSNIKFKPMLRLATDADPTYQLYAMTNRQITPYVQAISNPNLVDNPWFTVNQRGKTSYYHATDAEKIIDRWINNAKITVDVVSTGITMTVASGVTNPAIFQKIDDDVSELLKGRTVTFSVLLADGTIESTTFVVPTDFTVNASVGSKRTSFGDIRGQVVASFTLGKFIVVIDGTPGQSVSIRATKLELGSVSTLDRDTAPNYTEELLKCQRYFVRYLMPDNSGAPLGIGFYSSTTNARLSLTLPIEMRAKPTVNISDISKFKVIVDNAAKVASAVSVSGAFQNIITLNFTTDAATQYAIATLNRTTQGEYIDLSAEL